MKRLDQFLAENAPLGGLLLRAILGVVFVAHGLLAALVYTPAGMAQFFGQIGIPLPYLSGLVLIAVHLAGGAMILAGLFTRLNALLHAFVMAVATVQAHLAQGFFLTGIVVDPANDVAIAGGYEYALTLAVASLALAFAGPGVLALDNLLDRRRVGRLAASHA